jgi:hypothetical protein
LDARSRRGEREVVEGEYDQSALYVCENSIMKPTLNCEHRGGGERG